MRSVINFKYLDTAWNRRFSGSVDTDRGLYEARKPSRAVEAYPSFIQSALILMGDWCSGEIADINAKEITGAKRSGDHIQTGRKIEMLTLTRKKCDFFLCGEIYSLTRGLLMGNPVTVLILYSDDKLHDP